MSPGALSSTSARLERAIAAVPADDSKQLARQLLGPATSIVKAANALQHEVRSTIASWPASIGEPSAKGSPASPDAVRDQLEQLQAEAHALSASCQPKLDALHTGQRALLEGIAHVHEALHQSQVELRSLRQQEQDTQRRLRSAEAKRSAYSWIPFHPITELLDLITGLESELERLEQRSERLSRREASTQALAYSASQLAKASGQLLDTADAIGTRLTIVADDVTAVSSAAKSGDTPIRILVTIAATRVRSDIATLRSDSA